MWQLIAAVSLLFFTMGNPLAYAKITIQSFEEGTLLVTAADGNLEMYDPGEPVAEIASGSGLEVFGGTFTVNTETGDAVSCACLNHKANVAGGASVSLSCEEESGMLKVLKGTVTVADPTGKEHTLSTGKEYAITPGAEEAPAPPTEAAGGDEPGTPVGDPLPPFDTRTQQSSPSL